MDNKEPISTTKVGDQTTSQVNENKNIDKTDCNNTLKTTTWCYKPPDIDKLTPTVIAVKTKSNVVTNLMEFLAKKRIERHKRQEPTKPAIEDPTTTQNSEVTSRRAAKDEYPGVNTKSTVSKPIPQHQPRNDPQLHRNR